MDCSFRIATVNDLEPLFVIDTLNSTDKKRVQALVKAINDKECILLEVDNKLYGYAIFNYSFYHHGFISLLFIETKYRRQKFATACIEQIESLCKTDKLFTSTNQSNKPAQKLLISCGFELSGQIDNLDEDDPELVYFKRLT